MKFDWTAYWARIEAEEIIRLTAKERRATPQRRSITETIKACAPLLRPVRKAKPRDQRNAS